MKTIRIVIALALASLAAPALAGPDWDVINRARQAAQQETRRCNQGGRRPKGDARRLRRNDETDAYVRKSGCSAEDGEHGRGNARGCCRASLRRHGRGFAVSRAATEQRTSRTVWRTGPGRHCHTRGCRPARYESRLGRSRRNRTLCFRAHFGCVDICCTPRLPGGRSWHAVSAHPGRERGLGLSEWQSAVFGTLSQRIPIPHIATINRSED